MLTSSCFVLGTFAAEIEYRKSPGKCPNSPLDFSAATTCALREEHQKERQRAPVSSYYRIDRDQQWLSSCRPFIAGMGLTRLYRRRLFVLNATTPPTGRCPATCLSVQPAPETAQSDAQEREAAFVDWLIANGASFPKLGIARFGREGRGIGAAEPLAPGELVLRVPPRLFITPDRALDSPIGPYIQDCPDWFQLPLFVLHELHTAANSFWRPFLDVLDRPGPDSPLLWPEPEQQLALAGTSVLWRCAQLRDGLRDAYIKFSAQAPSDLVASYPWDDVLWAFATCNSRTFSYNGAAALIPFADFLNHLPSAPHPLLFDEETGDAVFTVGEAGLPAGAQLWTSYGRRSNGELLIRYGFVVAEDTSHDVVRVAVRIPPNDPLRDDKLVVLDRVGMTDPQYFDIGMGDLPPWVLMHARVAVIRDASTLHSIDPAMFGDDQAFLDVDNERAALTYLSTTLDELFRAIPDRAPHAGDPPRMAAGATLQQSERKILIGALRSLEKRSKALESRPAGRGKPVLPRRQKATSRGGKGFK